MELNEFLIQGEKLRQQDRTLAIAYFEQCLQNISITKNEDLGMTARVLLDLAVELIATKQPESVQRAQTLIQKAGDALNQNSDIQNSEINNEQKAYWLYVSAILALELGDLNDVLNILQVAYDAYGDNLGVAHIHNDRRAVYIKFILKCLLSNDSRLKHWNTIMNMCNAIILKDKLLLMMRSRSITLKSVILNQH